MNVKGYLKLNARFKLVDCLLVASNNLFMKTSKRLGHQIQKLRKETGLTQEEFAEKLGISRTHMGHIEQGRKTPSIKLMEKIAKALKVSAGKLLPF